MKNLNKCPKCKSKKIVGYEYRLTTEDYDGVSHWECADCGYRQGRWSGKELKEGELEKRPKGYPSF
jgi:Zn ribbon nucleic-acid-binding protein